MSNRNVSPKERVMDDPFQIALAYPRFACILYGLLWVVVSAWLLWPFSRQKSMDRLPLILCVLSPVLGTVIAVLPNAFPGLFQSIIGHSVYADSVKAVGSTTITSPWLETWEENIDSIFLLVLGAGTLWGIVNLCRRRAWVSNGIAVAYAVVYGAFGLVSGFGHILG